MEPIKPTLHSNRHYRYIELKNEIGVLLISDTTAKTGGAALDIAIGSFNDPVDLQGLAHFLEHMLFMGSKKYPDENAYDQFLQQHGGYSNAYTSAEHTVYHFEVEAAKLEQALDIFGAIFKEPLMDPSSTERELKSVHSEDKKSEKMDSWRFDQVLYECADEKHPRAKFLGGNLTSLDVEPRQKGINVREQLLHFHKSYYSSNLMKVCVAGPQTLEQLEKMARDALEGIENKKIPLPHFGTEPWKRGVHLGREIFFESLKTWRKIDMRWSLPSYAEQYAEATLAYLTHLIGHEGPGSLFAHLKSQGWATSLVASHDGTNRDFDVFNVEIELTVNGWENHREDVIALTYEYLDMLKRSGPQRRIYDELKLINAIDFDNMAPKSIDVAVTDWVDNMWNYPPKDILRGPYVMEHFNETAINDTLALFTPDNMLLTHCAKSFKDITLDKSEKWYGVKYHVRPIDEARLKKWQSFPEPTKLFALPKPNIFVPTDLSVRPVPTLESYIASVNDTGAPPSSTAPSKHLTGYVPIIPHVTDGPSTSQDFAPREYDEKCQKSARRAKLVEALGNAVDPLVLMEPELIVNNMMCKAYHLHDPMFPNNPKMSVRLMIHCPVTYSSSLSFVLTSLLCDLVRDSLNEYTYDATQAGIDFSLEPKFEGFMLTVYGYSEKIELLLTSFLERLVDLTIRKDRFEVVKQEALRIFSNFVKAQPYLLAQDLLDSVTCVPRWTQEEKFAACAEATVEDMQYHHRMFLRQLKLEVLMHGSIDRASALSLASTIQSKFSASRAMYPAQFTVQRCIVLPEHTDVLYRAQGPDPENANSAVFVWYQLCPFYNVRQFVMVSIVADLLSEHLYNILRTKEQLGYIVASSTRTQSATSGLRITIQSSDFSAAYLLSRVDHYMNVIVPQYLDSITDEQFDAQVAAEFSISTQRPSSPKLRVSAYWDSIEDGSYNFLRKLEEALVLKTLKKSEVIEFMKTALAEHRRLAILVQSQLPLEKEHEIMEIEKKHVQKTMDVKDHIAFRNAMPLHPSGMLDRWDWPELLPDRTPTMQNITLLPGEADDDDETEEEDEDGEEESDGESDSPGNGRKPMPNGTRRANKGEEEEEDDEDDDEEDEEGSEDEDEDEE